MLLKNKKIVITGASGILGAMVAKRCIEEGATIYLHFRSMKSLEKFRLLTNLELESWHRIFYIFDDCNNLLDLKFTDVLNDYDYKYDGFVNCIGMQGSIGKMIDIDWEDWQSVIKCNLLLPARMTQLIMPLIKDNGNIINISGGGATEGRANFSAYAVAKTGLARLTEILALENPRLQINNIAPGAFYSNMTEEILNTGFEKSGYVEYNNSLQLKEVDKKPDKAVELIVSLLAKKMQGVTGRLIAAQWDDWKNFEHLHENIYKLRRTTE